MPRQDLNRWTSRPAVFLDRDGTINEQMGYVNHPSRFVMLPRAAEAIRLLNRNEFLAIIVSNQAGAARGYFPLPLIETVHGLMNASLRERNAYVDAIFYCPHHPRAQLPELRMECDCRKPRTGLIEKARGEFDVDMARSYVVGDRCLDIELAHRCGLKGVLVKTGYGRGELEHLLPSREEKPVYIAEDLYDAVWWILEREKPGFAR
jgi:D-glycero-D-manno-heptose 1,7-bisphosphate phosphatase